MRRFRTLLVLASAASASLASIAQGQSCRTVVGNLVTNCSFEVNTITSPWLWVNTVTGWESNGSPNKFEIWRGLDSFAAADGMQHLELDVHHANSNTTISQMLNTQLGQEYTVTFSMAHRNGGGGAQYSMLDLLINDVSFFQTAMLSTPYVWNVVSTKFIATGSQTKLGFRALGTQNTHGDHLDNIAVVATVPEPSTSALIGAGLLALGVVARRRRTA
jgi:hypothetical protein